MKGIEFKAHKVEHAIELGLKELQLTEEEVDIEIISQGGLFSKAVVKIIPKIKPEQAALDFINNLFGYMKFDSFARLSPPEHTPKDPSADAPDADGLEKTAPEQSKTSNHRIEISGTDSAYLIGHRGDILDSLQYLALLVANKNTKDFVRISVNTESYREKRNEILSRLAQKLARRADRIGRPVELEPMNPYERRIIHATLQDSPIVTTESAGEEPNRYLIIIPKNKKPYNAERHSGRDYDQSKNRGTNAYGQGGSRNTSGGYAPRQSYGGRGFESNGDSGAGYDKNRSDRPRRDGGYREDSRRKSYGESQGFRRDGGYENREASGGIRDKKPYYDDGRADYIYNKNDYGKQSSDESLDDFRKKRYGGDLNEEHSFDRDDKPQARQFYGQPLDSEKKPSDIERAPAVQTEEISDSGQTNPSGGFSSSFKKNGFSKMKSFGYKKKGF